ncbi:MAG: hypothetical protein AB8G22_09555 [Saprospiraceae bacterium]
MGGELYFKIANCDAMPPFFMSIVSDSNHWMFIGSNGGLSAGRKNSDFALFPYYTSDKIMETADLTGSKSIFWVERRKRQQIWEPLSERFDGMYRVTRNLYKNIYGNKVVFEEINHDLELTFRYQWSSSDKFGFVRQSTIINNDREKVKIHLLDGIQNIVPAGVDPNTQNAYSNLVDAYKRNELEAETGLGIYAMSAILVDRAEPSEALKANVAWSLGLENPQYLVSSLQLKNFRNRRPIQQETDVKAEKGAYFLNTEITLSAGAEKEWLIVANVNQNHAGVAQVSQWISSNNELEAEIKADIEKGTADLIKLNAGSDALQMTADNLRDTRHFANTLFNIMRGGIFDENYQIEQWDFSTYLAKANNAVFATFKNQIEALPAIFTLAELKTLASQVDDPNFKRLCFEYLPLKFSRRHGDPSRPWNRFSINTRSEIDGSKILDYEGNWRDIFQNWEALAHSYPDFIESMIHKFLNASTFDGYNPYRVTKGGFDWEAIEPDDPWSYIGYWGDHQIIYLLKFLEFAEQHEPGRLASLFDQNIFVYANVPYKIKSYADTLKNPKDTIEFDEAGDHAIRAKRDKMGADGALIATANGDIYQVNFIEKILVSVLAKLSNFIPEGGIWMNTQRPEWNDANNALVGNGVSMVTLCYLRRFMHFFKDVFANTATKEVEISTELAAFFTQVNATFSQHLHLLQSNFSDRDRKLVLDGLGQAGSNYRTTIYNHSFSGKKQQIALADLQQFVEVSLQYLEHSIRANKRSDDLYHAYNLMTVENEREVSIAYLSEMLEGQVAVLSAGYLQPKEALAVLDGLKNSALFRPDQYSYILYPNKDLAGFIAKNRIPAALVNNSKLLQQLVNQGNTQLIEQDVKGHFHFNGNFRNADDVKAALKELAATDYASLVATDEQLVLQIFEEVFNHKAFTGRSGTFFGFEGLGSIYWHMVSKLLLAVQECCLQAVEQQASAETIGRLLEHYYEINAGIGVHKSPELYGAFPTDPYSHTPAGRGAQQPGMTGQVKEDILCRFGELGIFTQAGQLQFSPSLLRKEEFLAEAKTFDYIDIKSQSKQVDLSPNSLAFTYCQIPVIYQISEQAGMKVFYQNGSSVAFKDTTLDLKTSEMIFARTGEVVKVIVQIKTNILR